MVQKTHKHRLTRCVFACLSVLPFKHKYRITARYSTLDEKQVFASLVMTFNILSKNASIRVQFCTHIKHVLKQGMKIVIVSVHQKWDRLVTY